MKNFKLTRKLIMGAAVACILSNSLSSCKDEEEEPVKQIEQNSLNAIGVSTNITSDVTWTKDNIYILTGRVSVENGAMLTINAGTVIKGEAGTGANATALVVARGGKIAANGTATEPIIFTSADDQITSGSIASPNLDPDQNGKWGGLIILGKAPISASTPEAQIEGIPTSDANGLYGGTDSTDNSGVLNYVSIRHGGTNIGSGNEINGLTLGGVGSGTSISNIEVVGNQDDGIEWFGGSVNVTNALVWNVGDDGIDTDQGWKGTLDNFVVITVAGHSFELDGPEGSANGSHTIKNGTVVASDVANMIFSRDLINTDANSQVSLENIQITGIGATQQINRTIDNPLVSFTNVTLNVVPADLGNYIADASSKTGISASTSANAAGKANISAFTWTWAANAGKTAGL